LAKSIDGGTGTYALDLLKLKDFFDKKFQIRIYALERPSYRSRFPRKDVFFLRNKKFYPESYLLLFSNLKNFFEEILLVKEKIKSYNPDVILGIDIHANLLIQINKLLFFGKLKTVLTTHIDLAKTVSDKSTPFIKCVLKNFVRFFYRSADCLVFVSRGLAKEFSRDFGIKKKVVVIYNGIEISTKIRPKRSNPKTPVILTLARLVEQKDHASLIKAFAFLQNEIKSSSLWILSDGPERKKLLRLAEKLGLKGKVRFWGWVKDTSPYFRKSSLFVLSSKREGFGYALVEAMSYGLPTVSTDTPFGPSEILDKGKYGILVPVGSPLAIKNAMLRILSDPSIYRSYSRKSLDRASYFSLEKMLGEYQKLIISVGRR